jgi:hypothetical protein
VEYHNGVISLGSVRIYFIFYGGFQDQDPVAQVLTDFAASLNGTSYAMINSIYPDLSGAAHTGSILWARNTVDPYSRGASLSESDLPAVVQNSIANGTLPLDSNGLYVVVGSSNVTLPGLGQTFCALHGRTSYAGTGVSYAFLGHPAINPGACALQLSGPSGNWAADAQVYLLGVEFSDFIVNPWVTNGWFDRIGLEPADKCAWDMGPTYQAPNGASPTSSWAGAITWYLDSGSSRSMAGTAPSPCPDRCAGPVFAGPAFAAQVQVSTIRAAIRSALARMVRLVFTPSDEGITLPSVIWRPGYRNTSPSPSTTPSSQ